MEEVHNDVSNVNLPQKESLAQILEKLNSEAVMFKASIQVDSMVPPITIEGSNAIG